MPVPFAAAFASCPVLLLLCCSSPTCLCVRLVMASVRFSFSSSCSQALLSCVPITDAQPRPPPPSLPVCVYIISLHLGVYNQHHIKDRPFLRVCHNSHLCGEYVATWTASGPHLSVQRLCVNTEGLVHMVCGAPAIRALSFGLRHCCGLHAQCSCQVVLAAR